jgi:hypothetical protein
MFRRVKRDGAPKVIAQRFCEATPIPFSPPFDIVE